MKARLVLVLASLVTAGCSTSGDPHGDRPAEVSDADPAGPLDGPELEVACKRLIGMPPHAPVRPYFGLVTRDRRGARERNREPFGHKTFYPSFMLPRALVVGSLVAWSSALGCGESVEGAKFESVDQVEMGLGQNGGIKGHATVSFDAKQYTWLHSDLHCVGSYEVDGDEIVAEMRVPCLTYGKTIRAKLDGDRLEWAGLAYRRVE